MSQDFQLLQFSLESKHSKHLPGLNLLPSKKLQHLNVFQQPDYLGLFLHHKLQANIIGVKTPKETIKIDFTEGDYVKILKGSFKDQEGQVAEIDHEHGRVKIMVDIFGRMTPVEIEVDGVLKV